MKTLNNLNVEILEFVVNPNSKVANYKIRDIDFPRTAIIGGVIKEGQVLPLWRLQIIPEIELLFIVCQDQLRGLNAYFYDL